MDPELDPDLDPDLEADPDPDPLVCGTDPGIRITKMSRIPNTGLKSMNPESVFKIIKYKFPVVVVSPASPVPYLAIYQSEVSKIEFRT